MKNKYVKCFYNYIHICTFDKSHFCLPPIFLGYAIFGGYAKTFLLPRNEFFKFEFFLSDRKYHLYLKIGFLKDFLPTTKLNFFLATFFRVDGMLLKHSFYFMFLYRKTICDNEKRHSVNLDHGKCKSQKQTRNVQWVTQTDKWKHSNVLCTCTM